MSATRGPATILLVEDDEIDIMAMRRALKKRGIRNEVVVSRDGDEALSVLEEGLPAPRVLLLDLNMPRMTGLELLTRLRADARFRDDTVFVFTTSGYERDQVAAHEKRIRGYLLKGQLAEGIEQVLARTPPWYWTLAE